MGEAYVRSYLETRVHHYAAIADDDAMLTAWSADSEETREGRATLYVQHQVSGLRATFTPGWVAEDGARAPGEVLSKPYRIGSLDDERPGTAIDWREFIGLGIGVRIYLRGASTLPAERWGNNSLAREAAALRRKLHAFEPYVWQSSDCTWSDPRSIDWPTARAEDFEGHN